MLDLSHFPSAMNGADVQIFRATGQQGDFQTWAKPRGKCFVAFFVIGGGAGGGGGFSRAAGAAGGGGSGGGGGGFAALSLPAWAVPDTVYLSIGAGGAGGVAGAAGSVGLQTIIGRAALGASTSTLLTSHASNPTPGNPGSGTAGGTGVAGGTASTRYLYSGPCLSFMANAGGGGVAGGAQTGAAGTGITVSQWTAGGTGGGGATTTDFAGGAYTGDGLLVPNLAGGAAAGGRGADGFELSAAGLWLPLGLPGTGGGSNNAGIGGAGGNGALGCGGGGGGAGVTGGAGGRGGDGLAVVMCW
ncbi:MAG: hypothetical protein KGO53_00570 [Alphaproteobacteria bacterium]|nr:hypothetical protein [Alphaproteobacteria bacterium]